MKRLFIKENTEIPLKELGRFIDQFADGESLDSLSLCKDIKDEWLKFVRSSTPEPVKLKSARFGSKSLPKGNPPSQPGVYGIFSRCKSKGNAFCFYVGISSTDIRSRMRTHFGKDIINNYRSVFNYIERADEIFVCSSTLPELEKKNTNTQKLELL